MKARMIIGSIAFLGIVLFSASGAVADTVSWTDWTSTTVGAPGVLGTLIVDSTTVGVTFTGVYMDALTSGGTDFWNPSAPYISPTVGNAPPASDIIRLSSGGTATITFSEPVQDPLIALVSWNGNTVEFGVPITILSYGCGYWGCGTPVLNPGGTGFYGSGEVHGVIELPGTFTSISFTHTSEGWHGFTVGVIGLGEEPPDAIPEPASILLLGTGLCGIALAAWRRMK
jgi:hypothetical protein